MVLEDKVYGWNPAVKWAGIGLLTAGLVLGSVECAGAQERFSSSYQRGGATTSIDSIREAAEKRGYMTQGELETATSTLKNKTWRERYRFFADAINKDWLPFKAMFYLTLENEDYDKAELIRKSWVECLNYLSKISKWYLPEPLPVYASDMPEVSQKIKTQLETLQRVGLTDPMLITLRKELITAIKEKKWDDANKIQSIITGKINELQQSQVSEKRTLEDRTTVIVQQQPQSSQQYLQVEQLPRYGAEDLGRAISIFEGRAGKLDQKAEGTLKLLDIIFGRSKNY